MIVIIEASRSCWSQADAGICWEKNSELTLRGDCCDKIGEDLHHVKLGRFLLKQWFPPYLRPPPLTDYQEKWNSKSASDSTRTLHKRFLTLWPHQATPRHHKHWLRWRRQKHGASVRSNALITDVLTPRDLAVVIYRIVLSRISPPPEIL